MELQKTLGKINNDREKVEACFVFSLWKNPELFEDYQKLNEGNDETLKNKDAIFYYNFGKAMYKEGYRTFDHVSCETFLTNKDSIRKRYEEYGGYSEIKQLMSIVDPSNIDAYFDNISKMNGLSLIASKYDEVFSDVDRFKNASAEDVYSTFELLNNSVALSTGHKEDIEELTIDDDFIADLESGDDVGLNYGKYAPLLNYITLGLSPGMYMVGGHSGTGKSSFVFGTMIMGLHYSGHKSAIISNEMGIKTYKILLLVHILTRDLNYYGLTRKQLRIGKFNEEQKEMIRKAQEICKTQYGDIKFVKMFDNDIVKITKYMKKLKTQSVECVFYDTFKADDSVDTGNMWSSLMLDSRKLFQCASKLGICLITSYQLALHTTNQRYLDATCLSSSKQIKEIYETMVYSRPLWDDERPGEKFDVHPYRYSKENNKIKEEIKLEDDKKYCLLFIDKTRSDEDKQVLIYQWLPHFNQWKELGFARVVNDHRNF